MRRLLPASRSWYALVVSAALAACGGDGPTPPGGGGGGGGANTPAAVARTNDNTNNQRATVGTAVANAPAVRVTNAAGAAVANVTVTFAVTAGGGTLGATSATTNADGVASAGSWTLGATPGANTVTATVAGLTPVTFTATGEAAAAVALVASRVDAGGVAVKCVVRASGVVSCWGENGAGNLGDGSQTFRQFPANLAITGVTFASTALGTTHGCALTTAGAAYCWGNNGGGAVGDGSTTNRLAPVPVSGTHAFASLAAGPGSTCGVKGDGTVWCWGVHGEGATAPRRSAPTQLNMGGRQVTAISVALERVCGAVSTGGVMCWTGDIFAGAAPTMVNATLRFTALTGGRLHQCGLADDGRAYCWDGNAFGQLGVGDRNDKAAPTLVTGGRTFTALDAGLFHTCGLTSGGEIYCWGANTSGQVGSGVIPSPMGSGGAFDTPQRVAAPTGVQFAGMGIGGYTSCGVASTSNQVYCWGARATSNSTQVVEGLAVPTEVRDR